MNTKWYAIYDKTAGRLHATASIDLDDPDTEIHPSGQPFSVSGLRGIAHPDKLAANGLEAQALVVNPQEEPAPGKRFEWDAVTRAFIIIDIPVKTAFALAVETADKLSIADKARLKAML